MSTASHDISKEPDVASRPPLPPEGMSPLIQIANYALLACFLTLINRFIGLYIPLDKLSLLNQHIVASVYFAGLLYALMRMTRAAALLPGAIPTLLIAGISLAAPMGTVLLLQQQNVVPPTWLILTANNLFLPIGVALVGAAVGRIIKHPNTLLAAAGFAVFFDIVMVTLGTVAALTETGSQIISMVSVGAGTSIPHQTAKTWAIISGVTIGPADVLFLSVFFASVFLMRLEAKATFRWIFVFLLAALLEVEWIGYPVPALAPMGIAVIIANARFAAFTDREKRDLVIGAAFAVLCAGFIVWRAQNYAASERARMAEERKKMIGFQIGFIPASKAFAITMVVPNSRAEKAGIRAGDVVKKINGVAVAELAKEEKKYLGIMRTAAANGITLTIKSGDHPEPRDIVFPAVSSGKPDPTPVPSAHP
jgi:hypothetical protein